MSQRLFYYRCQTEALQRTLVVLKVSRFLNRATGLLNHIHLDKDQGLLLVGTRSVHTRGMLFSIDIVFLSSCHRILHVLPHVPPGRICVGPWRTSCVLELSSGEAEKLGFVVGKDLVLSKLP